jgi:hypothetical protein
MQKIKNFLSKLDTAKADKDEGNEIFTKIYNCDWMNKEDEGKGVPLDHWLKIITAYSKFAALYNGAILTDTLGVENNNFSLRIQFTNRKDLINFNKAERTMLALGKLMQNNKDNKDAIFPLLEIYINYELDKYD